VLREYKVQEVEDGITNGDMCTHVIDCNRIAKKFMDGEIAYEREFADRDENEGLSDFDPFKNFRSL